VESDKVFGERALRPLLFFFLVKVAMTQMILKGYYNTTFGGMMVEYKTVKIPVATYNQVVELQEKLEGKKEYEWIGALALGAIIGYAVTKILEEED